MVTATQRCPHCCQYRLCEDYHPDKWGKVGHYCRDCVVEYKREWRRWSKGQGTHAEAGKARRTRQCAAAGCERWPGPAPRKYCDQHPYSRSLPTGYNPVHKRVARIRGKAATHSCAHCTAQAEQWAYDHADPAEMTGLTDRGIVTTYSLDPDHYLPLCRSCHVRFDNRKDEYDNASMPQPRRVSNW